MENAYLELIRADGKLDRYPLTEDKITVGTSDGATIAVPDAPDLEPLHLLISPRDDGCWVSTARNARISARRQGRLFENGVLPWGAELDVGTVMFRLARAEAGARRRRRWMKHLRKILLLMACVWVAQNLIAAGPSGPPRTDAEPPALFGDLEQACPARGREATARAREALDAAQARAERYPFAPHDGVEAVRLFASAEACLQVVGDKRMAAWAAKEEARMRLQVEEDYRFHCLRLERALDHRRYEEALRETRVVAALLRDEYGPYADWLVQLDRALELRIGGESN